MSIKMFPPKDTVYNILNNQNNCEQQLLDFYNAYIMAVSCVSVYTDAGDYKKYYIEELENEIKNRIIRLFFMICVNTENGIKYRMVIGLVSRKAAYCP